MREDDAYLFFGKSNNLKVNTIIVLQLEQIYS